MQQELLQEYLDKCYVAECICVEKDGLSIVPSPLHAAELVICSCLGQLMMTSSHHCSIHILRDFVLIVRFKNLSRTKNKYIKDVFVCVCEDELISSCCV